MVLVQYGWQHDTLEITDCRWCWYSCCREPLAWIWYIHGTTGGQLHRILSTPWCRCNNPDRWCGLIRIRQLKAVKMHRYHLKAANHSDEEDAGIDDRWTVTAADITRWDLKSWFHRDSRMWVPSSPLLLEHTPADAKRRSAAATPIDLYRTIVSYSGDHVGQRKLSICYRCLVVRKHCSPWNIARQRFYWTP